MMSWLENGYNHVVDVLAGDARSSGNVSIDHMHFLTCESAACCMREPPAALLEGSSPWTSKTYNADAFPTQFDASHPSRVSTTSTQFVQTAFHLETHPLYGLQETAEDSFSSSFSSSSSFKPIEDVYDENPLDESTAIPEYIPPPAAVSRVAWKVPLEDMPSPAVSNVAWKVTAEVVPADETKRKTAAENWQQGGCISMPVLGDARSPPAEAPRPGRIMGVRACSQHGTETHAELYGAVLNRGILFVESSRNDARHDLPGDGGSGGGGNVQNGGGRGRKDCPPLLHRMSPPTPLSYFFGNGSKTHNSHMTTPIPHGREGDLGSMQSPMKHWIASERWCQEDMNVESPRTTTFQSLRRKSEGGSVGVGLAAIISPRTSRCF